MSQASSSTKSYGSRSSPRSDTASSRPSSRRTESRREKDLSPGERNVYACLPEPHKLYIVLWVKRASSPVNDFHWGFYYHRTNNEGWCYRFKYLNNAVRWWPDHQPISNILDSKFLCVLIAIGVVAPEREGELDTIMKAHDNAVNAWVTNGCRGSPAEYDRFWAIQVVLPDLVTKGLVKCDSSPSQLRDECVVIGNQHRETAAINQRPRPTRFSTSCSWSK
jgi:hypothetical protein